MALWLVLAMTLARMAPIVLVLVVLNLFVPANDPYRLAGTLVAIAPVVLLAHTTVAARSAIHDRSQYLQTPDEDYVRALARAARAHRVPVPTVVFFNLEVDAPQPPVAIRGWRWCLVTSHPNISPADLIARIAPDLRDGTARLRPLLWSFDLAVTDWAVALRMLSTPFRREVRTDVRWYIFPLLVLLPAVLLGYGIAWVLGTLTQWLLPRRISATRPGSADARVDPGAHDPGLPQVPPSSPLLRRVPDLRPVEDLINPMARIIIALLVTFLATYHGPGILPAERIVWPWERGPEPAEVMDVQHTPGNDGLLGNLGLRHNSTWQPTVILPDGTEHLLPEGSTELAEGTAIPVVTWFDDGGARYRHLHQTSLTRYIVMTVVMLGVAVGLSRPFSSTHPAVIGMLGTRRLAQADHDQRVLTGRRHRRRRPRYLFGNRFFDDF